jgi:hypothetical protein
LAWEWASVIVLVVILSTLLIGGLFSLIYQIEPGPWLEVGGMMLAANEAEKMKSVIGSIAGVASQKAKEARFHVRVIKQGVVQLVDEKDDSHELKKEERYVNEGPMVIARTTFDWKAVPHLLKTMRIFFSPSRRKRGTGWRTEEVSVTKVRPVVEH